MPSAEQVEKASQDVICQFKNGKLSKPDTVRELFPLIYKRVVVVAKFFGVTDEENQDDLCQEVMLRLLRTSALESYDPLRGPFLPYLDKISRNVKIDHLHRLTAEQGIFVDVSPAESISLDEFPLPHGDVDALLGSINFTQLLATLPERERMLLFHRYVDGLSIAELAASHGETESNIKFWIARAIQQLCKLLNGDQKGGPPGGTASGGSGVAPGARGRDVSKTKGVALMICKEQFLAELLRKFAARERDQITDDRLAQNLARLEASLAVEEQKVPKPKTKTTVAGKLFGLLLLILGISSKGHAAVTGSAFQIQWAHAAAGALMLAFSAGVQSDLRYRPPLKHYGPPPLIELSNRLSMTVNSVDAAISGSVGVPINSVTFTETQQKRADGSSDGNVTGGVDHTTTKTDGQEPGSIISVFCTGEAENPSRTPLEIAPEQGAVAIGEGDDALVSYTYSAADLPQQTDALGQGTSYTYDALNRIRVINVYGQWTVGVTNPPALHLAGSPVKGVSGEGAYVYDASGNLIAPPVNVKVTAVTCNSTSLAPSSSTACSVTLSGAAGTGGATVLLASSSPAATVPTSILIPQVQQTDALGQGTSYTYDALNRITVTNSEDQRTIGVVNPAASHSAGFAFVYDASSNQIQQTDALGQGTSYTYDALNRIMVANSEGQWTIGVVNPAALHSAGLVEWGEPMKWVLGNPLSSTEMKPTHTILLRCAPARSLACSETTISGKEWTIAIAMNHEQVHSTVCGPPHNIRNRRVTVKVLESPQ